MYRSVFARDVFAEMDRLQRDMQQAFDLSPTIRGIGRSGFPALNVGGTPQTIEVYAFAPGLDPDALEVQLDRGLLTLAGVRHSPLSQGSGSGMSGGSSQEGASREASSREGATQESSGARAAVHINERFEGAFRRVITLPEDADPEAVQASYRDGVLRITVQRRASAQPRRIAVQ
jgi:HSP20 family protein